MFARRTLISAAPALALAGMGLTAGNAAAAGLADHPALLAGLKQFLQLPGGKGYQIDVGEHGRIFRTSYKGGTVRFVGSAVKTFILTKFLQDVEDGLLDENTLLPVDDRVRSLSSPVLIGMSGEMPARMALEAMISHSDNTATDMAMAQVTPARVRALIRAIGLRNTVVPDSTRRLFSYLAGAPAGVDKGWAGMEEIMAGRLFGEPRHAINPVESMLSTPNDFVAYYTRALNGRYFKKPATLTEFKRIQAMADAIAMVVPPDLAAYAKGGSIDWGTFHALCIPGQMILPPPRRGQPKTPVTFCFVVNWEGPDSTIPTVTAEFIAAISKVLAEVERRFG
ncbi:MAG TPA: serine hydrolase [Geminicoccus sp.]|uniref:serine hydrolase n=1 Tax=Geminicoccus sp. TaxID=2024832 RepID=UPI002B8B133F|nr:serine hydrolase [Geminicoccus sp.]HWL70635.1 serine hydrolase [Geminicoccus sp.]